MVRTLLNQAWFAPLAWSTLAACGAAGLIAIACPAWFTRLSSRSSTWVDSNRLLEVLDTRVDIDQYVLPYSRVLGVCVLAAVGVFATLLWKAFSL